MSKYFIYLFIITILIISLNLDQSEFPDYDSYKRIYNDSSLFGTWEMTFTTIAFFFKKINLNYDNFREFILIFSSFVFILILKHSTKKFSFKGIENILLFIFILISFFLEYSLIRIRAGLCISFILLSFIYFDKKSYKIAILFYILSFYTHQLTSIVLLYLLFFPLIFSKLKLSVISNKSFYFILSILFMIISLFLINIIFMERGTQLYSPLNPVRFSLLAFSLIFMLFKQGNSHNSFIYNFNKNYSIFIIGLIFLFYSDRTIESGEALVRVYTLASIPSFIIFINTGVNPKSYLSIYILITNALFFIYTLGFFKLFNLFN